MKSTIELGRVPHFRRHPYRKTGETIIFRLPKNWISGSCRPSPASFLAPAMIWWTHVAYSGSPQKDANQMQFIISILVGFYMFIF